MLVLCIFTWRCPFEDRGSSDWRYVLRFLIQQDSRPVLISSRLPNSPLFLIWEIILELQIASLSARDLTSKLETQAQEISSRYFAQRSHIVRVFGWWRRNRQIAGYFATSPRYLGMIILTEYPANCNFRLMKTRINWIICDRDSSNSGIFCNLKLMKTGLVSCDSSWLLSMCISYSPRARVPPLRKCRRIQVYDLIMQGYVVSNMCHFRSCFMTAEDVPAELVQENK